MITTSPTEIAEAICRNMREASIPGCEVDSFDVKDEFVIGVISGTIEKIRRDAIGDCVSLLDSGIRARLQARRGSEAISDRFSLNTEAALAFSIAQADMLRLPVTDRDFESQENVNGTD